MNLLEFLVFEICQRVSKSVSPQADFGARSCFQDECVRVMAVMNQADPILPENPKPTSEDRLLTNGFDVEVFAFGPSPRTGKRSQRCDARSGRPKNQKSNFSPNCMMRGKRVAMTWPKRPFTCLPAGSNRAVVSICENWV